MKRTIDVAAALTGLIVLLPLLIALGILVRTTSPGPAIFRQTRVGRHEKRFEILKFRTMRVSDARSPHGLLITSNNDPRVTRVGRYLRSRKLDELPQLINVLRGDMSLVGPRPEVPQYVDSWDAQQRRTILSVRPGITDPASIEFRNESTLLTDEPDPDQFYRSEILPRKLALYVEYVNSQTFLGDLRILARTARSVARW